MFRVKLLLFLYLLVFIAACSPYEGLNPTPTATRQAAPTATEATKHWETFPLIPSPTSEICTVNAGALYLRSGAGMSYAVKKILHAGDLLQVIKRGAWLKVETSQHTRGWVYSKYCKLGDYDK